MGQKRAPLSYVIRENPDPNCDRGEDKAYDFEQLSIN